MSLPIILVNSATGSDTQASGAGPATALFGTTDASFSGATVTLTASTDLSGVATDGSHVLYLLTSTGVRFFKITAKAGSGGATPTVDVTPNPAGTSTGRTWAIGGKRATIASASSALLFANAGGNGDWMPGWIVEMQSGHTETITAAFDCRRSGDQADGPLTLRGSPGAATMPVVTFSNNGNGIVPRGNYQQFFGFEIRNSNGTKTASIAIMTAGTVGDLLVSNMVINHTDYFWKGISTANSGLVVENCVIGNTASTAITAGLAGVIVQGCEIYATGDNAIAVSGSADGGAVQIKSNVIHDVTGDGINIATTASNTARMNGLLIENNTIDDTTGDAIEINIAATQLQALSLMTVQNNLLTNIGGYGFNFSGASISDAALNSLCVRVRNNNIYTVTSGRIFPTTLTIEKDGTSLDPQYVGGGNFTPTNASIAGTAYPTSIP